MVHRIAVCDDEKNMLRQLEQYLSQYQEETGEIFEPFYYASGEDLLQHIPRNVEVVLLDIGMGGISGLETARRLRAEGVQATLIFITSMTEYALEGYSVHAFSFLSKPVLYAELRQQLSEALAQQKTGREDTLVLDSQGAKQIISPDRLLYVEVYQHESSFVMENTRLYSALQLSEVENKLRSRGFFRCHRSYLVNLKQISRIDFASITMQNGDVIPLSKYRRKDFMDAYASYMGVRL